MSEAKYTLEENGSISVQNLSAYWIPDQSIRKVIHGTTMWSLAAILGQNCSQKSWNALWQKVLQLNPKKTWRNRRNDP